MSCGNIQTAMVFAAGFGKRLRPLTNQLPKPLLPVAGKSMLLRILERLEEENIRHVLVNTHYMAPMIQQMLND